MYLRFFLPIVIAVLLFALGGFTQNAYAIGFQGFFDPSNWTFTTDSDGFVDTSGAPDFIELTGGDDEDPGPGDVTNTDFTIVIPSSGVVTFDWVWHTDDSSHDFAFFLLNGVAFELTDPGGDDEDQSGSESVDVKKGDVFGFRIDSDDDCCDRGDVTISNYVGPSGGGGGGPAEPPTIGQSTYGNQVVTCGVAFDTKCFTITAPFHEEFKLYEMMSGTHTISITMYCARGVNTCNYAAIGIMPYSESMDNTTWKIELYKDFEGNVTPVITDPEGFLGTVTVTTQIIDDEFWIVSFTIDFKNKDTGPMMFGVQARDDQNAVRNWYLNEGVEIKDSDAYPSIETEFEESLEIDSLCLNEDPDYRNSCAFAKIRERTIQIAEETLRQIMNN